MTMDQIIAYRKYFRLHPPIHLLAAASLKYKPPADSQPFIPPALPDIEE